MEIWKGDIERRKASVKALRECVSMALVGFLYSGINSKDRKNRTQLGLNHKVNGKPK